jgi:hypothetical protein
VFLRPVGLVGLREQDAVDPSPGPRLPPVRHGRRRCWTQWTLFDFEPFNWSYTHGQPSFARMWTIHGPFDVEKPESKDPKILEAVYKVTSASRFSSSYRQRALTRRRDQVVEDEQELHAWS